MRLLPCVLSALPVTGARPWHRCARFGFEAIAEERFISVAELFPEAVGKKKPGRILAGARGKEGLTQKQLAEKCGIAQGHICEMEQGRRPIGLKTARVLGEALNIGYKVFL